MSYLIPYENFCIVTELNPDEVKRRMEIAIRPYRPVIASWGGKRDKTHLFKGTVTGAHFCFRSDDYSRSECLVPIAKGSVSSGGDCCNILIKIKPARKIWIPYAFGTILATFMAMGHAPWGFGILLIISLFSYPFLMLIFKYETSGMKSALCRLIEGEIRKKGDQKRP